MKRGLCVGVVGLMMVLAGTALAADPTAEVGPGVTGPTGEPRAMWDLVWSFSTVLAGQPGVETDGTNIYTCTWSGSTFSRFQMNGTWVADFTIAGVANIRDFAYDGTYFYGGQATNTIYIMDLANETLVGTIPVTASGVTGVRHIAYDPTLDSGNGGFWIGNWDELGAVTMTGAQIYGNIAGNASCYGSAYDPYSTPGSPRLLLFQQTGTLVDIHGFDLTSLSYQGLQHSATDVPGYDGTAIAGGLAIYEDPGTNLVWLIGNLQQSPNIIFAYELAPVPVELQSFTAE